MYRWIKSGIWVVFASGLALNSLADDLDTKLKKMAEDPTILAQGKTSFEQVCASCHSKDLSGASGFNLKDGEWIHGSSPTEILANVKRGFMNAGMPGFKGVFSDDQLNSIVAYVLSKREGFEGLTYKIYQMDDAEDKNVTPAKLIKSGKSANNLADFQLPEIKHYTIEFEGTFYALKDKQTQIWVEWGFPLDINFYIDGEEVKRGGRDWYPTWQLKQGKQHLKIVYRAGDNKPHMKNASLIVTNPEMTIKWFAVSTKAHLALADNKLEVTATDKTLVLRKRIHELPPYSISVGLPAQLNYAFNTRTCSVVALWNGGLLNVGPNVSGRGENPSLPLGDWLFRFPQSMDLNQTEQRCQFKGYTFVNKEPKIQFELGDTAFTLMAIANTADQIRFDYQVTNPSQSALDMALPQSKSISWATQNGSINQGMATITPDSSGKFSITANIAK